MRRLDKSSFIGALESTRRPFHENYYAMYSSVLDGIITDPVLMTVPIDDHMVHRGDGVFETFKCVNRNIYNMRAHIERLFSSAASLQYKISHSVDDIEGIVTETVRACGRDDCLIRLFVSRGIGSFGVNPYDCPRTQLYVVAIRLERPFMEKHPGGAKVMVSSVPVKSPFLARVKNCNYLSNVLMKKEAVDAGADFAVAADENGFLLEGATENIGIVSGDNALLFPRIDGILRGTTMVRVMDLAARLVADGVLARTGFADIPVDTVAGSREVLIVGTTPDVTAVTEFNSRQIGGGKPGPVYERLSTLLLEDIRSNHAVHTRV